MKITNYFIPLRTQYHSFQNDEIIDKALNDSVKLIKKRSDSNTLFSGIADASKQNNEYLKLLELTEVNTMTNEQIISKYFSDENEKFYGIHA
jgi:hypothetical protein